jgi:hypothetical protein
MSNEETSVLAKPAKVEPTGSSNCFLLSIGIVLGAWTLFGLIRPLLDIPQDSVLGNISEIYSAYRTKVFQAVGTTLQWLGKGISGLPHWVLDLLILYGLGGSGMFVASVAKYQEDKWDYKNNRRKMKLAVLNRVLGLSGRTIDDAEIKWGQVLLCIKSPTFAYARYIWVSAKWPLPLSRNLAQWKGSEKGTDTYENSKSIVLSFAKRVLWVVGGTAVLTVFAYFHRVKQ